MRFPIFLLGLAALGGGLGPAGEGLFLAGLGLWLAVKPPERGPGRLFDALVLVFAGVLALRFLPSGWLPASPWREALAGVPGLELAGRHAVSPGASLPGVVLALALVLWIYPRGNWRLQLADLPSLDPRYHRCPCWHFGLPDRYRFAAATAGPWRRSPAWRAGWRTRG